MHYTDKGVVKKVFHFFLLVVILIIFSKLTIDAVILGALAMFIYQQKTKLSPMIVSHA